MRGDAWGRQALRELEALDRTVYEAVAGVPTPSLDRVLARLSDSADHSKLWLAGSGVLAILGGRRGRRAALAAVASIGLSSLVSNLLVKPLLPRGRPDRDSAVVPTDRWVRMPTSASFPSGHSASAFAFASAVGAAVPVLSLPAHLAAAAVAYSRVHSGVHYPADTIVGALLGTACAAVARHIVARVPMSSARTRGLSVMATPLPSGGRYRLSEGWTMLSPIGTKSCAPHGHTGPGRATRERSRA